MKYVPRHVREKKNSPIRGALTTPQESFGSSCELSGQFLSNGMWCSSGLDCCNFAIYTTHVFLYYCSLRVHHWRAISLKTRVFTTHAWVQVEINFHADIPRSFNIITIRILFIFVWVKFYSQELGKWISINTIFYRQSINESCLSTDSMVLLRVFLIS